MEYERHIFSAWYGAKYSVMSGFCCKRGPTNRGTPFLNADGWLAGKRVDDDTDGFWRIHDALYDLSKFDHPGGKFWIEMSKGTDITELFESSHPNIEKARLLLPKFFVRNVDPSKVRNTAALTFHPDGFYCTLRSRVWEILKKNGGGGASWDMDAFHDLMLSAVVWSLMLMMLPMFDEPKHWVPIAFVAGFLLSCLGSVGHNYFHHKDNWRMLSWDLTLYSSYEWRITHGYSHHNYPNSALDFEVSVMEPFVWWLPVKKSPICRGTSYFVLQILTCLGMFIQFISRYANALLGKKWLRPENLLPLVLFAFVWVVRSAAVLFEEGLLVPASPWPILDAASPALQPLLEACLRETLLRMVVMYVMCSWVFHNVSLAAGHHHPEIWHEGDAIAKEMDFGVFQLCAVGDRPSVDSSAYVSACCYGQHAIHHLFPTVDQSKLGLLIPALKQTCKEFFITKDSPAASASAEDVATTSAFLENRQMSILGGYMGMVSELSRSKVSSKNVIASYHEKLPGAQKVTKPKAKISAEVVATNIIVTPVSSPAAPRSTTARKSKRVATPKNKYTPPR